MYFSMHIQELLQEADHILNKPQVLFKITCNKFHI